MTTGHHDRRIALAALASVLGVSVALATPHRAKLSKDLADAIARGGEQRVIVTYADGLDAGAIDALGQAALRSHRRLDSGRAFAATFRAADLDASAADPRVVRISPDRPVLAHADADPGVASTGSIEAWRAPRCALHARREATSRSLLRRKPWPARLHGAGAQHNRQCVDEAAEYHGLKAVFEQHFNLADDALEL